MHKSMKCMKLSLLLFLRRLGGTRVSVSSFSCLKHQDTLIFLPCPVFSTASFCKTNLPKNSPINTKFKYLCLFVSLLLCRLTEKWDDEFRGKKSRVPLCVSEMWRNVKKGWWFDMPNILGQDTSPKSLSDAQCVCLCLRKHKCAWVNAQVYKALWVL